MRKVCVLFAAAAVACQAAAYEPSAAEVGAAVQDAGKLTASIGKLAPADQVSFVKAVNAAIAKMPGSTEAKTATFLNAARAALAGAAKGNHAAIVAEIFATVPPASLTVLSESFATDLLSRTADASKTYTDEQFSKIADATVAAIAKRCEGMPDASAREVLAVAMMVRASNGKPAGLSDSLLGYVGDEKARDLAKKEWLAEALAEGDKKSYDSLLAYSDAGTAPDAEVALRLSGPQMIDALLGDLSVGVLTASGSVSTPFTDQFFGGFDTPRPAMADEDALKNAGGSEVPRTQDPTKPWYPDASRSEAGGYKWTSLGGLN